MHCIKLFNMHTLAVVLFGVLSVLPVFADGAYTYHLNTNDTYVLFLGAKVKSYSLNSADMVNFQVMADISNTKSNVIISAKNKGTAVVTVLTSEGKDTYNLIIDNKDSQKDYSERFYKLDTPPKAEGKT